MNENILSRKRLCVGCGACAAVCRKKSISFHEDEIGHYVPNIDTSSCVNCGICLKNCPVNGDDIETPQALSHNKTIGGFAHSFIGYDEKYRNTSASGGLTTSFLAYLLASDYVDIIICLKPNRTEKGYYSYSFITAPDDLISTSKSAYYPMQITDIIEYVRNNDQRYGIVVLPCQAKAIRLLQRNDKKLRERIKLLVGLVCGGLPGKAMIEYVRLTKDIKDSEIERVVFREKDKMHKVSDYSMRFINKNGCDNYTSFLSDTFGFAFLNHLFVNPACNICNDIFAEYADIVFMDAWLKEYDEEIMGTSICVARTQLADEIAYKHFKSLANVKECSIDVPINAQQNVAIVLKKKTENFFNRYIYKTIGYSVKVYPITVSIIVRIKSIIKNIRNLLIQRKSRLLWLKVLNNKISIEVFNNKIHRYINRIKMKGLI